MTIRLGMNNLFMTISNINNTMTKGSKDGPCFKSPRCDEFWLHKSLTEESAKTKSLEDSLALHL